MIKSELSKKAIELAEKDAWNQYDFSEWKRCERIESGWITFGATTKQLILMYRSLAKKELEVGDV